MPRVMHQLIEDVRNDITQLDPFFSTAARVADLDQKRSASLQYHLRSGAARAALTRWRGSKENALIVQWVGLCLQQRKSRPTAGRWSGWWSMPRRHGGRSRPPHRRPCGAHGGVTWRYPRRRAGPDRQGLIPGAAGNTRSAEPFCDAGQLTLAYPG